MTTLSQLLLTHKTLMDIAASNEGEITDDLGLELIINGQTLSEKVDAYAYVLRLLEEQADREREEARKRTERARTLEKRMESMRGRVKELMSLYDVREIEGNNFKFQAGRTNQSISAKMDLKDIPREFHREKIEITLDKEKALQAMLSDDRSKYSRYFLLEESPSLTIKLNTLRRIDDERENHSKSRRHSRSEATDLIGPSSLQRPKENQDR